MTDTWKPPNADAATSAEHPDPHPTPGEEPRRGRTWPRRVLAGVIFLVATGGWLLGQTFQLLLFAPTVVVLATLVHRAVAARQGRLNLTLIRHPLAPSNRAATMQLAVRVALAVLVVLAADIALLDIEAGGMPSPTMQWLLVVVPLPFFVGLQLIPTNVISRSLNAVAVVSVAFLAFQLVQVHQNSDADEAVTIRAPFEGEWHVASAGRSSLVSHHWTPLADQRYAVDFLIERDGRTYDGDRDDLASYYCWDQPLLAPVDGTVVTAEDGNPDVPIGETDVDHLGGNAVVIQFGPDRYVQLAHLRSGSVEVEVGQQVRAGDVIGRCGNSGHSLEPHLHLQVQDTPSSNSHHHRGEGDSIPFRFGDATHVRGGAETSDQTSLFRRNDRVRTGP